MERLRRPSMPLLGNKIIKTIMHDVNSLAPLLTSCIIVFLRFSAEGAALFCLRRSKLAASDSGIEVVQPL